MEKNNEVLCNNIHDDKNILNNAKEMKKEMS
jgi:hypothetical protein